MDETCVALATQHAVEKEDSYVQYSQRWRNGRAQSR